MTSYVAVELRRPIDGVPVLEEFAVRGAMQDAAPRVTCVLEWCDPRAFGDCTCFPRTRGVYAILFAHDDGMRMVRIGATRDARRRPANYDRKPFELEPRLRIAFCAVPCDFTSAMSSLIHQRYPVHSVDIHWLEYRIEHKLLEIYRQRFGCLPPANFQRGSKRDYACHIDVVETGGLHVLDAPPADLSEEVRFGLRQ